MGVIEVYASSQPLPYSASSGEDFESEAKSTTLRMNPVVRGATTRSIYWSHKGEIQGSSIRLSDVPMIMTPMTNKSKPGKLCSSVSRVQSEKLNKNANIRLAPASPIPMKISMRVTSGP